MSRCATNLQVEDVGFSTHPYMCVTRSLTTSLRTSGVSFFSSIAFIIDGLHLLGIVKVEAPACEASPLLEMVDPPETLGVEGMVTRDVGVPTSTFWDDAKTPDRLVDLASKKPANLY